MAATKVRLRVRSMRNYLIWKMFPLYSRRRRSWVGMRWGSMRCDTVPCDVLYIILSNAVMWCVCIYTSRQWTLLEWKVNRGGWPDIYYFPDNVQEDRHLAGGWTTVKIYCMKLEFLYFTVNGDFRKWMNRYYIKI